MTAPEILARIDAVLTGNDTQHSPEAFGHITDKCVRCGQLTEAGKGFCRWCTDHIDDPVPADARPTELVRGRSYPGHVGEWPANTRLYSSEDIPPRVAELADEYFANTFAMNLPAEPPVTQVDTVLTLESLTDQIRGLNRLRTPSETLARVEMHPRTRNQLATDAGHGPWAPPLFHDRIYGIPITLDRELDPDVMRFHYQDDTTREVRWRDRPSPSIVIPVTA